MNILIIGSGGREHALATAIAESIDSTKVVVTPGNPGMLTHEKIETATVSRDEMVDFIKHYNISLVVIGPEAALADGLSDLLRANNIAVFGPSQKASQLESSKIYCKEILGNANVPTSDYLVGKNYSEVISAIDELIDDRGIVLKADGLASGKGVVVCKTREQAALAANNLLEKYSQNILVEKVVTGKEVSAMYLCLGTEFISLGFACDHKRLLDNDLGPNTGGMGAYSPVPWLDQQLKDRIASKVIRPVLIEMKKQDRLFSGVLFAGLMIDHDDLNVLEFNVRFGDPETQTILPLLDWDALHALKSVANEDDEAFSKLKIIHKELCSVHVVKASQDYPENPILNRVIQLQNSSNLYFAGVRSENNQLVTSGGRVLGATGLGASFSLARGNAYRSLNQVHFKGAQFRSDIGRDLC